MTGATVPDDLYADRFALGIGSVSVGLPPCATADRILARYLDLVRLLHRDPRPGPPRVPDADLGALARLTRLGVDEVAERLVALRRHGELVPGRPGELPVAA